MPAALTSADASGARDAPARRPPLHVLLGPWPLVVIAVEGAGSILFHANHGRWVQSSLALAIGLRLPRGRRQRSSGDARFPR
jgi:hypothetical protein